MTLAEHIKRRKAMNEKKTRHNTERKALEEKQWAEIRDDTLADRDLLKKLIEAYRRTVAEDHDCKCCDPRYPDEYHLDDDGLLHVRYDADHPNDIRDVEILMSELIHS